MRDATTTTLSPVELIVRKREGGTLTAHEIQSFIDGFTSGKVADYQMSAWLMAALLRGLDDDETLALTRAMLHSGDVLELRSVRAPKVDKHSTGGVGDKISICLAPLVAACGVAVPMISGRGLGHTGGTLDKLEAIPGYQVGLEPRRFEKVVREVGTSMIGQTARLAPADRRIYALRDVTGTVESIPLIVASILSKKLAEGIDALVLDVKVGRGAFMKDRARARALARALVRVGRGGGKQVVALITDMDTPIGASIGNALETREAIEVLAGGGPPDTRELTLALGAEMLLAAGAAKRTADARRQLESRLQDGSALDRLARMVEAHGGDARVVHDPARLPTAPVKLPLEAPASGFVTDIDPLELGLVSVAMGAGRTRADQAVDHAVGIELCAKRGERVERGAPLAFLHVRSRRGMEPLVKRAAAAFRLGPRRPRANPLVIERVAR
ncbi:MAG: thymidine phosphorylase [Sorangiineae bacterium]|nr:thymidine phosphorylase [Polyangiaceae bacterium]MEB2320934.1 thymidine phosphorylase [Sorangiineae bacterium]